MFKINRANKKKVQFNCYFLLLCVLAGIGSALFSEATDKAYDWCIVVFNRVNYGMFLYIPLIFTFIVFIFKKYFPYAGGSGLPQGYALDVFDKDVLHNTYSLRTMIGKVGLTFMSILGGASLGREGPTIQICASIFASIKNISIDKRKFLIRIGSGVGVATAFNAPLGGIIFAIEEYIKHSSAKLNAKLIFGIAVAGYAMILVSSDYSYMGSPNSVNLIFSSKTMLLVLISGVVCGLSGALFTWLIVKVSVHQGSKLCNWRKQHYLINAFICGFVVALICILSKGLSLGNGAITTKGFLNQGMSMPWYYALVKAGGALFSVAAGVPGGYFSTALSIGSGMMGIIYHIIPNFLPVEQFYLLGMVAFLAAITNAPITAVAMVLSIVNNSEHLALPLTFASILGSYIASIFGDSVYHQQVLIYVDKDKYASTKE